MGTQIYFKKEVPADTNQLIELYKDAGWSAYTKDTAKLMRAINKSAQVYCAYCEDKVVGFARTIGDGESITYVQDLLVHSEYRRNGIGTELMKLIFDDNIDVSKIVLLADINDNADSFYKSLGFLRAKDVKCRAYMNI